MQSYIYLASPYSHPDKKIMNQRYETIIIVTGKLMERGLHVYSSIVHCHPLAVRFDLPRDHDYWDDYNAKMLKNASMLMIVELDGWQDSKGITSEIALASEYNIPVVNFEPPMTWFNYDEENYDEEVVK